MTARTERLIDDVHVLAGRYHWTEPDVLALDVGRRSAYLDRLGADDDRAMLSRLLPAVNDG